MWCLEEGAIFFLILGIASLKEEKQRNTRMGIITNTKCGGAIFRHRFMLKIAPPHILFVNISRLEKQITNIQTRTIIRLSNSDI